MILRIGRKRIPCTDLAEASRLYQEERNREEAEGRGGASAFPFGRVWKYRLSYNGRVWEGKAPNERVVLEATPLRRA